MRIFMCRQNLFHIVERVDATTHTAKNVRYGLLLTASKNVIESLREVGCGKHRPSNISRYVANGSLALLMLAN